MKNVRFCATIEELAKEIRKIHKEHSDVWIFLSNAAIKQIDCCGLGAKETGCEKWRLLTRIKFELDDKWIRFDVTQDPKDVLFFDMT